MRVHVEWLTSKMPHMRLDRAVWEQAAARHADAAAGLEMSFGQDLKDMAPYADADVVIGQVFAKDRLAGLAPRLKWLYATSAGIEDLLPLDWLPPGAVLTNNSGTHYPKARAFAGMLLQMLQVQMPTLVSNQRRHHWQRLFATIPTGKTVAILGFGALGTAMAEAARDLGLRVRVIRRNPAADLRADAMFGPDRLADALDGADFLVIAAPLTPATRGLIDGAALDRLADGAGVVNIGRGLILDTGALCQRLDSGRLSGAILDVFDQEPLPADSPLWDQKNLILTPHVLLDDPDTYIQRALDIFFAELARYRAGAPFANRIDPDAGY